MKCPFCGSSDLKVIDSRDVDDSSIRRRRQCEKCGKRFTTYERIESVSVKVLKKNGNVELFNSDKIRNGIIRACEKRPVNSDQIDYLVKKIENFANKKGKISSKQLGNLVMSGLKKLDNVAYIRFASVYKNFTDLDSFKEELLRLNKNKK